MARRPIIDFQAYLERLSQWVFRSGLVMKPVFDRARQDVRRVVYCEGEESRVLLAAQAVVDEGIAYPVLIGRRDVVLSRIEDLDLRLKLGEHFELCDPQADSRYNEYWRNYHALMERKGVSPDYARTVVRTRNTVIGTLMVRRREAEALICGTIGRYDKHLEHIVDVIGMREGVKVPAAMNLLIMPQGTFFICDSYVTADPAPAQIVDNALLAAEEVRRFGIEPKLAFLSHSNFGARDTASAQKMREAISLLHERAPYLEAEGEMHGDAALEEGIRARIFPNSRLKGQANLLIMPNLDAANISFNLLKVLGEGLSVGPMLMGAALPAHILTPSATVRNIVNMTALAAVDAQVVQQRRG